MKFEPQPRNAIELGEHLQKMHGVLVYSIGDYEDEHAEQHQRAEIFGNLGDHEPFWTPHKHTVTEDEYREAWSAAYWAARDDGCARLAAMEVADEVVERMLEALENQ